MLLSNTYIVYIVYIELYAELVCFLIFEDLKNPTFNKSFIFLFPL